MLFKLSNLNASLVLTLGYLNPALNNSAQICFVLHTELGKIMNYTFWKKLLLPQMWTAYLQPSRPY